MLGSGQTVRGGGGCSTRVSVNATIVYLCDGCVEELMSLNIW